MQEVVSGLRGVTVEVERFAIKYKTCPVADAMNEMAKGLGGNLEELCSRTLRLVQNVFRQRLRKLGRWLVDTQTYGLCC